MYESNEEEYQMNHDQQGDSLRAVFTGLGIGLLVGLAIGVLVAPKTGQDTRSQLKGLATDIGKKAKDLTSGMGDKFATTKDTFKKGTEAIKHGAQAAKEGYKEKMGELKEEEA
jgi:gas vesicle protein